MMPYPANPRSPAARPGYGRRTAVLMLALALDGLFGDPPNAVHPVAWLGRLVQSLDRRAPAGGRLWQLAWGVAVAAVLPAGAALTGAGVARVARRLPLPLGLLLEAAALKPAFAVRSLIASGTPVWQALRRDDLPAARAAVGRIVSRDTAHLDAGLVAAAAVESLAENLTDSVLAPWLWYLAGGTPAALAYRTLNTLDSMIGYHGRYEYLGKPAARIDDLANLLPARLGALLIAAAAPASRGDATAALGVAWRQHGRTASPNAGWTMAAAAGALGVTLEKQGHYQLGTGERPAAADIRQTQQLVAVAAGLGAALVVSGLLGRRQGRDRWR